MNIVETILNSQGGQTAQNLAKQFNLNPQQVQGAVQNLVPQLMTGLKDRVSQNGIQAFIKDVLPSLTGGNASTGEKLVQQILGDQGAVNNVISKVSGATGIDASKLQAMLPGIASLVMGAVNKTQGAASGAAGAAMQSPLGQLAGDLLNKAGGSNAASGLMSLLDSNKDGNIADDVMNLANKFLKR